MNTYKNRITQSILIFSIFITSGTTYSREVHICKNNSGVTTYSDVPCTGKRIGKQSIDEKVYKQPVKKKLKKSYPDYMHDIARTLGFKNYQHLNKVTLECVRNARIDQPLTSDCAKIPFKEFANDCGQVRDVNICGTNKLLIFQPGHLLVDYFGRYYYIANLNYGQLYSGNHLCSDFPSSGTVSFAPTQEEYDDMSFTGQIEIISRSMSYEKAMDSFCNIKQ